MTLGLSAADLERRRKYVCASDVAPIMRGEWRKVWLEKTGRAEPEDLSGKLPVQMGSYTEPFNLWWCERQEGRPITYFSGNKLMQCVWTCLTGIGTREDEFQISKEYPWMACSLDALSTTRQGHPCVLDAKHVGQFRYDELVQRYTPACTHQAIVMGARWWALSVLIGNGKWEWIEQEVDPWYESQVISETRDFWTWVEAGEEPLDKAEPEPPPKPQPRRYSLSIDTHLFGTPEWGKLCRKANWAPDIANEALTFAETDGATKRHFAAREAIKKLLPEDVGSLDIATAKGTVDIKQDGRGVTITMREKADG